MCGWIWKGEFRALAGARNQLPERRRRHRSAELRDEQVRGGGVVAPELTECAELGAADRMRRGDPILESGDVQEPRFQVHLVPAETHEF